MSLAIMAPEPASENASDSRSDEPLIWRTSDCAEVRLQVQDDETSKPVKGAWVHFPALGAEPDADAVVAPVGRTDADGTFVLPSERPSWVQVTKNGLATVVVDIPCSETPTAITLVMKKVAAQFREVASSGGDAHRQMSGEELSSMAGAPRNVFQAVQTLPGVVRPTLQDTLLSSVLGTGDLAVRGARPGESKLYLDGIEIPYFYHYLGLSSVIPAEMLEFADLVPTGAGPQFGRFTGGVLDARSRATKGELDDTWHGRVDLTLFEGAAIVRGPAAGGALSISERFSIWDLVAQTNGGSFGDGFPVWGYNDFQVIYKRPVGTRDELRFIGLGAWDDVRIGGSKTRSRTEFYRTGLMWRTQLGSGTYRFHTTYGYDGAKIYVEEPGEGLRLDSDRGTHDLRVAADAEYRVHQHVPAIRTGVELHGLRPEVRAALDWEVQEFFLLDRTYYDYGIWGAAWGEVEIRPIPRVVILPGLRYDYDTLVGRGWMDPRLTARWFIDNRTVVSLSGGLYHRPFPFALAFVEDEHLGLSESRQLGAGVEYRLPEFSGMSSAVDVRGYYHEFRDQVQGIEWLPQIAGEVVGDGESFGGEVYYRFEFPTDGITGRLGYSLSRTQWRNEGTEHLTTPSDLDNTHGVLAVLQYDLPRGWTVAGRARFYTGFPYTTFDADVYIPDVRGYVGVGESPWAGRAPIYFQSDVRVTKRWDVNNRLALEWFFDLQNATFRPNVDRLTAGGKPTVPSPQPALPFLPSTGLSGSF